MAELKPFPLSLGIHSDYQDISQAMLPDSLINCQTVQVSLHLPSTVLLNRYITANCEATGADYVLLEVNGTLVNDYTTRQALEARGIFLNNNTFTLSVYASRENNQTIFRCQAFWNGNPSPIFSDTKILTVFDTIIWPKTTTIKYPQLVCFNCTTCFLEIHWAIGGEIIPGNADNEDGQTMARHCFYITRNFTVTCLGESASLNHNTNGRDTGLVILREEPLPTSTSVDYTDQSVPASPPTTSTLPSTDATGTPTTQDLSTTVAIIVVPVMLGVVLMVCIVVIVIAVILCCKYRGRGKK